MKTMKIYLWIMGILFVGAIACGVYVWYTVQSLNAEVKNFGNGSLPAYVSGQEGDIQTEEEKRETISVETLSDSERTILESFMVKAKTTITHTMIVCAREAVGEIRLVEIIKGGAPTPLESPKLISCFEK